MAEKSIDVASFASDCLRIIDDVQRQRDCVVITVDGRPVAMLKPVPEPTQQSIIGALKGSVLRYDDPCLPTGWSA